MNPTPTAHFVRQAQSKGFTAQETWLAMTEPHITYPSGQYPHQERRIRNDVVCVVDTITNQAITVYKNVVETDLRPDQIARGERISR